MESNIIMQQTRQSKQTTRRLNPGSPVEGVSTAMEEEGLDWEGKATALAHGHDLY